MLTVSSLLSSLRTVSPDLIVRMNVCSGCWDDVTDVFVIETDEGPVVGLSSAAADALTVAQLIRLLEKRDGSLEVQNRVGERSDPTHFQPGSETGTIGPNSIVRLHFDTGCLSDIEGTFTNEDAFVLSDQDWFQV